MDRLQARVAKLGRILEVAKALVAERDLDRLLKLIVQAAARVVEADRCSLFLVDKAKGELWSKVARAIPAATSAVISGATGAAPVTAEEKGFLAGHAEEHLHQFDETLAKVGG